MIPRRLVTVAVLSLIVGGASGCAPFADGESHPPTSARATGSDAPPPESPTELSVEPAPGEPRIGTISSARGTEEIGPVPSRTGRVAVYIRCVGTGILTVEVVGSATFTQRCLVDARDPGTRNTLDISGSDVHVTGVGDAEDIWAIAVTEIADG